MQPENPQIQNNVPTEFTNTEEIVKSPTEFGAPPPKVSNRFTMVTILLLIFFYPLGVIAMWLFMKRWPTWTKIIITLLALGLFIVTFMVIRTYPLESILATPEA